MLCLGMIVYTVLCVTMDVWDCECEYTCERQIYMTSVNRMHPCAQSLSNGSQVDLLT